MTNNERVAHNGRQHSTRVTRRESTMKQDGIGCVGILQEATNKVLIITSWLYGLFGTKAMELNPSLNYPLHLASNSGLMKRATSREFNFIIWQAGPHSQITCVLARHITCVWPEERTEF